MYAPLPDSIRTMSDGTIHASTRRHLIVCLVDGSIVIENNDQPDLAFRKPGANR